jgi:hypothetical protein
MDKEKDFCTPLKHHTKKAKDKKRLLVAVRVDERESALFEFPTVKKAREFAQEMKNRPNTDVIISGFKWGRI